ncbi:MAG: amidohydrolase [Acholeplasmataceae bacterium]|nr:amidohydrolase [Acholeplasmataceae bacterium]
MKLWKNGYFYTMENKDDIKHQLATDHGVIIGFDDEVEHLQFDEIIDLKGQHVYPGFVDAHLHLIGYGRKLSRPNLLNSRDKLQVISILKQAFEHKPLFAEGYFECGITKLDLNQISETYPIMIRHNDYHSLTVNDVVLDQMKYKSFDGVLTEEVAEKAMRTFPRYTHEELKKLLEKSIRNLYSYGVTGGHSDDLAYYNGFSDTLSIFDEVLETLPFRAHLIIHHHVMDEYISSNRKFLDQTKYLQLGAIKMFYDGTVSSKTALMKHSYHHQNHQGLRIHTRNEFEEMVKMVRKNNLTVAIHVIGDLGTLEVLEILKKYPPKKGDVDRLIHTPWLDLKAIMEMKDMPLTLDIQPQFLSSDLPWALDYFSQIPEFSFPWKTLLENKINLAGSSDAPIEVPNPLLGMYAAIMRKSDHDQKTYFINESLSRYEAITLYTKGANFSTMHKNRGQLKKGFIADFTVTKENLFDMDIENFKKHMIYATIIDEKIVYKNEI